MDYLTSGEAARLLGVGPDTIKKYYDNGLLTGHVLPGRGDLRVERQSVERVKESRIRISSTVSTISEAE
jgi:excisionase family DNA binding protein